MGQLTKSPNSAVGTRLETDLTPASDRQIFDELEALFLSFGTDAERLGQKRVALYVDACRGEPVWAVRKGIEKVRKGRDDGKTTDFLPSTQRVAREVRGESDWARQREEHAARMRRIAAENAAAIEEAKAARTPTGEEAKAAVDRFLRSSRMIKEEETYRG